MRDFNIKAQADPSGFNASLAARFKIGDVQITTVLSPIEKPADAYRVLRLGEMSRQPTDRVTEQYPSTKGQGWGNLAKSLGIKPGSKEFHALKRGHDLDGGSSGKSKGKGHDKNYHSHTGRVPGCVNRVGAQRDADKRIPFYCAYTAIRADHCALFVYKPRWHERSKCDNTILSCVDLNFRYNFF